MSLEMSLFYYCCLAVSFEKKEVFVKDYTGLFVKRDQTGKMESKVTTHTCIPVSLALLRLLKTPEDAVVGLNHATY